MSLSTYEKWKDTEIEWPKSIPEHWELKQFRYLFTFGRGLGITKSNLQDEGVPCINYGEIHSRFGFEVDPERHELKCVDQDYLESGERSLLKHGDFVFADTSEDIEGAGNFSYLNSEIPTFAGYHTVVAKPETNSDARFLAYLIDAQIFKYQIRKNVSGVKVYSITQDILKNCYAWLPSEGEQEKIVTFLDYKIRQIDQLIEKKETLIEKLNEQRIAVITQAVSKGINENAKMKPSGIEWLGDIPEHWKMEKLKYSIDMIGGGTPNTSVHEYWNGDIPWVSPKDMKFDIIISTKDYITKKGLEESATTLIEKGALLIVVRSGILRHSIPVAIAGKKVSLNQDMKAIMTDRDKLLPEFIKEIIWSNQKSLLPLWAKPGCTVESIETEYMKSTKIAFPPIGEQRTILNKIRELDAPLERMIKVCSVSIRVYKEYRSALITSAVTGKINVQNIPTPSKEAC